MYLFSGINLVALFLLCDTKTMGPPGTIHLDLVEPCGENPGGDVELETDLHKIDALGSKALSATIRMKIPLDDAVTYKIEVRKWDDGWKLQMDHSGKLCEETMKFAPKLWDQLKSVSTPEMPDECSLEPGEYKVKNLKAMTKDMAIPSIYYGKLQVEIWFYRDEELISCLVIEGDSQAPAGQ
ncbi:hypothetical protein PPYR_10252 [Photinus pyralis]|uniref:MD-2-related lipid-recognition domain-containing protein n=2 Tax=Photinus pyralis TaxID=7054 RepID=A0A5N4AFV0_PHOPY|nr:uncharacterized protein LOC116174815 [Photinus pyralis]KAB0796191.1 hypothetical protein PPYR_10252 [Photinus pyralis]